MYLQPLTARRFFVLLTTGLLINLLATYGGAQVENYIKASPVGMNATQMSLVSTVVVALTQLIKWMGLPDKRGPLAVLVLAILGVGLFGWSQGAISRASAFDYFAAAVMVAMAAAGVFGFTRSLPEAITKSSGSPPGAGASPTA